MQEKKELRKEMLTHRDAMDLATKQVYDQDICARLEQLINDRWIQAVHTYLPMGSEIDISPLIEQLLVRGIKVATPKAMKGRKMVNLLLKSLTDLEDGMYGTKHPANSEEFTGNYDLFIIPGLAFDRQNYRLGYGSGYYDTFLRDRPAGYKLGICYPFQMVDKVPTEAHDIMLDAVMFEP